MIAWSQICAFAAYKKDRIEDLGTLAEASGRIPESSGNIVQHPAAASFLLMTK
jgi:hypothetical protein